MKNRIWIASLLVVGCGGEADKAPRDAGPQAVAVDIQEARTGRLAPPVDIVGTTRPRVEVVVRARVAGRLLALEADVGDVVKAGQRVARLEDDLPRQALQEAAASLAAARAEGASAAAAEAQSRLALQQAQVDAQRYGELAKKGISSRETAEQRATAARSAVQQRESQVAVVAAARARTAAQSALVQQARERLSYVNITAPLPGKVLERLSEPGNLLAIGDGVLRIGDLSEVKVVAAISELDLQRVAVGRQVQVKLDAYPELSFRGVIARVSPQADSASRLVPIEVTIPNPDGTISAGLLARMRLEDQREPRVLVPTSAVTPGKGDAGARLFVPRQEAAALVATARPVVLGREANGEVEVLEGLTDGERYVVRSARPLRNGAPLRASAISGPRGDGGADR